MVRKRIEKKILLSAQSYVIRYYSDNHYVLIGCNTINIFVNTRFLHRLKPVVSALWYYEIGWDAFLEGICAGCKTVAKNNGFCPYEGQEGDCKKVAKKLVENRKED